MRRDSLPRLFANGLAMRRAIVAIDRAVKSGGANMRPFPFRRVLERDARRWGEGGVYVGRPRARPAVVLQLRAAAEPPRAA